MKVCTQGHQTADDAATYCAVCGAPLSAPVREPARVAANATPIEATVSPTAPTVADPPTPPPLPAPRAVSSPRRPAVQPASPPTWWTPPWAYAPPRRRGLSPRAKMWQFFLGLALGAIPYALYFKTLSNAHVSGDPSTSSDAMQLLLGNAALALGGCFAHIVGLITATRYAFTPNRRYLALALTLTLVVAPIAALLLYLHGSPQAVAP